MNLNANKLQILSLMAILGVVITASLVTTSVFAQVSSNPTDGTTRTITSNLHDSDSDSTISFGYSNATNYIPHDHTTYDTNEKFVDMMSHANHKSGDAKSHTHHRSVNTALNANHGAINATYHTNQKFVDMTSHTNHRSVNTDHHTNQKFVDMTSHAPQRFGNSSWHKMRTHNAG